MTHPLARPTKYCHACAAVIDAMAVVCPRCGVAQGVPARLLDESDKRILPAFVLCFFLGVFGVHRFYAGKVGTGILQLVTVGGFGIWWIVDLILIAMGRFRDGDGERISEWT